MGGTLVIFDVLGVRWLVFRFWELFRSFSRFRGCIVLFLGIECVLDIFVFTGEFWSFSALYGGILVLFK